MRLKNKNKRRPYTGSLIFTIITLTALSFLCGQCYALRQTWGQIEILRLRRPIPEVLADANTPQTVRQKLLFVEKVRRFIQERMQLDIAQTFQYYTQLDRPELAWNVSASESLALKAKTWWFPIVGDVPYLGYFEYADAKAKADALRKEGWDVSLNTVAAYSTLGWFDDPLLSTQLNYSKWYLAQLLIHECAHANLWFVDDVSFNESFASFVGQQGALQFFKESYGVKAYRARLARLQVQKKRIISTCVIRNACRRSTHQNWASHKS